MWKILEKSPFDVKKYNVYSSGAVNRLSLIYVPSKTDSKLQRRPRSTSMKDRQSSKAQSDRTSSIDSETSPDSRLIVQVYTGAWVLHNLVNLQSCFSVFCYITAMWKNIMINILAKYLDSASVMIIWENYFKYSIHCCHVLTLDESSDTVAGICRVVF